MRRTNAPSNATGNRGNTSRWNPYGGRGNYYRNRGKNKHSNISSNTTADNNQSAPSTTGSVASATTGTNPIESFMIDAADTGPYSGWKLYFPQTGTYAD